MVVGKKSDNGWKKCLCERTEKRKRWIRRGEEKGEDYWELVRYSGCCGGSGDADRFELVGDWEEWREEGRLGGGLGWGLGVEVSKKYKYLNLS